MRLHWYRQQLVTRHAFTTARSSQLEKQTVVVVLEHEGIAGFGEAAPVGHCGQTLESTEAALAQIVDLLGDDPWGIEAIVTRLLSRFSGQRAAVSAIDSALHDWAGKKLGLPVWRLLGLDRSRIPLTSFTIGVDAPDIVARNVIKAAEFPILKIKLGKSDDLVVMEAVRRHAPNKRIRIDVNAGWPADEAADQMRRVSEFDVEFIEQPTPPGDLAALRRLRDARIAPILADESCLTPKDVVGLAGCVDGVNIKLAKCGGIRQARRMIELAHALDMEVMLGCMIESSLGIAAAAQLAPLVEHLDLDGHLLLAHDPFEGIGGAAGRLTLTHRAGLGVAPASGSVGPIADWAHTH